MSFIEAIKYLVLGVIQGVTEVLPISSSGHVEITKYLLSVDFSHNLIFLIFVNTGSLLTFILIYYKKIWRLLKGFFVYIFSKKHRETHKSEFIMTMKLIIASVPAAIVGILFNDSINHLLTNYGLIIVAIGLLITATTLYYITSFEPFSRGKGHIKWWDTLFMGIAQALALIPGVSRSGMTSSAALRRGVSVDAALDFSFLMYIPVSFGSTLLVVFGMIDGGKTGFVSSDLVYYVLAFGGAVLATYAAYKLIFSIFKSGKLRNFSYYCLAISALALVLYVMS